MSEGRWQSIGELAERLARKLKRKEDEAQPTYYSERDILEILRANRDLKPEREKEDAGP